MLGNFIQEFFLDLKSVEYLRLSSPAFKNQGTLPKKYTCFGKGISPPLRLESFSPSVRAFALTFGDDAKHYWVVYYIDGSLKEIPENAQENGLLRFGINDFGVKGYTPPCPTKETLFKFTLYALSEPPPLEGIPTGNQLMKAIGSLTLGESYLICYVKP